ncbi:uncharacterized protein LOC135400472 [Ornithodoros turicata]|uniref:uncharacterized protein LOC135400472 n=1 Tax=Ornithodoros turicata TaxID=34597 RepID=UPI003139BA28
MPRRRKARCSHTATSVAHISTHLFLDRFYNSITLDHSRPTVQTCLCSSTGFGGRKVTSSSARFQRGEQLARSSAIRLFRPILDGDGILRVGGRLEALPDPSDLKHPILLPSHHRLTSLIIMYAHLRLCHASIHTTLLDLRDRYWLLKGRQTVKRVLRQCRRCRRTRLRPESALVAPLPRERITPTTTFNVTGVDFCGPLYVRVSSSASSKAYAALFTCAVTRAIHLELVTNMTAPAFLLAFRRFVARRGVPSLVYSDNARTFHRCAHLLTLLSTEPVQDFASNLRITWRFSPPSAPWRGGWWERMIRTAKSSLRLTLGHSRKTFEELVTILHEVEAAVNSRPLTSISTDPQEVLPLTPSHFLVGSRIARLPLLENVQQESTPLTLRRRSERRQQAIEVFWKRWKREYVLQLRSAHQGAGGFPTALKPGDLVIVEDDRLPPLLWKTAIVVATHPGRDGIVRSFTISLANGRETSRPAQRLYLLEAHEDTTAAPGRMLGIDEDVSAHASTEREGGIASPALGPVPSFRQFGSAPLE